MEDSCCIAKCLDESTESLEVELKVGCVMKSPGRSQLVREIEGDVYGHVQMCWWLVAEKIQQYKYAGRGPRSCVLSGKITTECIL